MSEFEFGPSSISTLYFVPDFIKEYIDENESKQNSENKSNSSRINNYLLRHNQSNYSTARSINTKSVSDHETMAFVGLQNIIKINSDQLAQLYNYNNRQYDTFLAAINNSNIDYNNLINCDEFAILYRFFARVSGKNLWIEICSDLGLCKFFSKKHIENLYDKVRKVRNLQIRVQDTQQLSQLKFFMQLMIFYWDNINNVKIADNFDCFWVQSLSKIITFISDFAVDRNIEIYCVSTQSWKNATITRINKSENQLYVQYMDGTNKHGWFSFFSPRLAPIGFKYFYVPNTTKRNNVPCIACIITDELNGYAQNHIQVRNTRCSSSNNVNENIDAIPMEVENDDTDSKIQPALIKRYAADGAHPNITIYKIYGNVTMDNNHNNVNVGTGNQTKGQNQIQKINDGANINIYKGIDEKKEMEMETRSLKKRISVLKVQIDPKQYESWNYENILLWILSLENGRFKQYENTLSKILKEARIKGSDLSLVEKSDIKEEWGITQFGDKKSLFNHIQSLLQQKQDEGDIDMA